MESAASVNYPVEADPNTIDSRLRLLANVTADLDSLTVGIARFTCGLELDTSGDSPEGSVDRRLDLSIDLLQRSAVVLRDVSARLGIDDYDRRHADVRPTASVAARLHG